MLCFADRAAREFVARLQKATVQTPLGNSFFFCFAPVRATVVLQAKIRALTSSGMAERPKKKPYEPSLTVEYESGVFGGQD